MAGCLRYVTFETSKTIMLLQSENRTTIQIARDNNNCHITAREETVTIGELLRHFAYEVDPGLTYCTCDRADPKVEMYELKLTSQDPVALLVAAAKAAIDHFDALAKEIQRALK